MTPALLDVQGLEKRFGALVATDRVDLEVRRGEVHALIGPNGAGKTTLVEQLGGQLPSDRGRIVFDGVDVTSLAPHQRARRGWCDRSNHAPFQERERLDNVALAVQRSRGFGAWRRCAPRQGVRAGARGARRPRSREGDAAIDQLSHAKGAPSSGMALASRPLLMLLDEPMAEWRRDSARMERLIGVVRADQRRAARRHDVDAVFRPPIASRARRRSRDRDRRAGRGARDAGVIAAYLGTRPRDGGVVAARAPQRPRRLRRSEVLFDIDLASIAADRRLLAATLARRRSCARPWPARPSAGSVRSPVATSPYGRRPRRPRRHRARSRGRRCSPISPSTSI